MSFIDPTGANHEDMRRFLHEAVDLLLDMSANAVRRSPLPPSEELPLAALIPDRGRHPDEVWPELRGMLARSMNAAHPGYIGHMDSIPTVISVAGEMLSAAINNNMLSEELSPVFTQLEGALTRVLAGLFGLSGGQVGGVMTSGGSVANLHALTVARNIAYQKYGADAPLVILASDAAHSSVQKAAMILGVDYQAAPTNDDAQLDVDRLPGVLEGLRVHDKIPMALVGTAGTTITGNIDPLQQLADIAAAEGMWFHVDAAYGGALIFAEPYRSQLNGIELADSVTFNPQKWLFVAKTCAMALFADMGTLQHAFRMPTPYMQEDYLTLGEIGVQGTRHADVLKLWLSLQHLGMAGYAALIEQNMALTDYLLRGLRARPTVELASPPELNIVCWRYGDNDDRRTVALQQRLLAAEDIFVSLPLFRGRRWCRAVLLNPFTTEHVLDRLLAAVDHDQHHK